MDENKIKYCECGCGRIPNIGKYFVHGHHINIDNPSKRPEVRKKISEAKMGHPTSKETRKKISETFKRNGGHPFAGKHLSKEHIEKVSKANKGKKRSIEFKQKMSEVSKLTKNFTGHKHSEESKKKMSLAKKGKKLNISPETRQRMSKKHSGSKNHFWNGGTSFEPYTPEFNKKLKRKIRERDNYTCQRPGCTVVSKSLFCHHINYIKKNSSEKNLVSLCDKHHGDTNVNREFWQLFYEELMDMKIKGTPTIRTYISPPQSNSALCRL